jgi:hypothetical protein
MIASCQHFQLISSKIVLFSFFMPTVKRGDAAHLLDVAHAPDGRTREPEAGQVFRRRAIVIAHHFRRRFLEKTFSSFSMLMLFTQSCASLVDLLLLLLLLLLSFYLFDFFVLCPAFVRAQVGLHFCSFLFVVSVLVLTFCCLSMQPRRLCRSVIFVLLFNSTIVTWVPSTVHGEFVSASRYTSISRTILFETIRIQYHLSLRPTLIPRNAQLSKEYERTANEDLEWAS